ncbi:MAG: efflux RND transporter periplasmic adaptor subunit [Bdellovibrionales bacterium]
MSRKSILISGASALAVGIVIYFTLASTKSDTAYKESPVVKGSLAITILSTGTVQPENRLEIKPPIPGRVEQVLVKEGENVKKGQILAWMSSSERAALLDAARAEGPKEVKRWSELYRPTPVLSPIDGTIILRNVESGQTFASTDSILSMSDRLTVKAQVDETDIAQIKVGESAEIILDAYSTQKVPGKVDKISYDAKTVNSVTTYEVDVLPVQTPDFMRSGMTANVTFQISNKEDIVLVSNQALKNQNGATTVMVKTADGRKEKELELGISDGRQTEILSGLSAGDVVLIPEMSKGKTKTGSPFSPMGQPRGGSSGGKGK